MALVRKVGSASRSDSTDALQRLERAGLLKTPVNIYGVAEFLGLEVKQEAMDEELSGYLEPLRSGWVVGVNSYHHPNRQRFTIAHEVGHFLLHKPATKHYDVTFARRSGISEGQEREADEFAAKLLMPEADVRKVISSGETSLDGIATQFGVSKMAAKFRVQKLGYVVR